MMRRALPGNRRARRNAMRDKSYSWPGGVVPYVIDANYNPVQLSLLYGAINRYEQATCVRWIPRRAQDTDYVAFVDWGECSSEVGRVGGRQDLSLGGDCASTRELYASALHEMMHALGFFHEHERWDRDRHVTVFYDNMDPQLVESFSLVPSWMAHTDEPYDYTSIMHYHRDAASTNGRDTIVPADTAYIDIMGAAKDFSATDMRKINAMYCAAASANQQPKMSALAKTVKPAMDYYSYLFDMQFDSATVGQAQQLRTTPVTQAPPPAAGCPRGSAVLYRDTGLPLVCPRGEEHRCGGGSARCKWSAEYLVAVCCWL